MILMGRNLSNNRLIRGVFGDETSVGKVPMVNLLVKLYVAVVIVTYVLLTIAPVVTMISTTPLSRIRMILGLLGALLLAVDAVTNRGLWRGKNCILLYGICVCAGLSALQYVRYGLKDNLFDLAWVAIQFGLTYSLAQRLSKAEMSRFVRRVFAVTLVIWFAACCVSVYQFAMQIGYRYTFNPNSDSPELCRQGFWNHRLFGVFTGLDYAAYISLAHLIAGISVVMGGKNRWLRIVVGIMLIPIALYLVLCGSRSVQVALFLYASVFGWLMARNRLESRGGLHALFLKLAAALCALAVAVGCYYGVKKAAAYVPAYFAQLGQMDHWDDPEEDLPLEPDADLLDRTEVKGDISNERFKIWRDYLGLYRDVGPFGLSLSNYNDYIAEHHGELYIVQYFRDRLGDVEKTDLVYECHNNYLFVLVSTGWIGLALFVVFILLTLRGLLRDLKTHPTLSLEYVTALAIVGIGCVQAMFMNSVFLKINAPSFIFWLALGMVNAAEKKEIQYVDKARL